MSFFVKIREYEARDEAHLNELIRNAYLSLVKEAFINALTREITFQLIVTMAAVMFIFFGFPIHFCLASVPVVMVIIYLSIYSAFLMKATELSCGKRSIKCWIAEAYQPLFSELKPERLAFRFLTQRDIEAEGINLDRYQRKIVGTISVSDFHMFDGGAWLFRLAVDKSYRRKGIGFALVDTIKNWCRTQNYTNLMLAVSECQENARQLFATNGAKNVVRQPHQQLFHNVSLVRLSLPVLRIFIIFSREKHQPPGQKHAEES